MTPLSLPSPSPDEGEPNPKEGLVSYRVMILDHGKTEVVHTGPSRGPRRKIKPTFRPPSSARLLAAMPDDAKPEPVPFPVEVTVNGVRVTVTLMLKPGVAVTVEETKTTTEPTPPEPDPAR